MALNKDECIMKGVQEMRVLSRRAVEEIDNPKWKGEKGEL